MLVKLLLIFVSLLVVISSTSLHFRSQYQNQVKIAAQKLDERLKFKKKNQGGLSGVTKEVVIQFILFCQRAKDTTNITKTWLPSIRNFQKIVEQDPVLRFNWEVAIHKSQITLKKYASQKVFDIMDSAIKLGPKFSSSQLVGFPVNSIFSEFMQTQNGRAFFSSEKVNHAFKEILDDYGKMLNSKESLRYMNSEPEGWFSKEGTKAIDYSQFKCDPSLPHYGFKNWHQLFLRQFLEGQRPIGASTPKNVDSQNVILNVCESKPLSDPIQPYKNAKLIDRFWLKDTCYSLYDILAAKKLNKEHLAAIFEGGTVYQGSLSALDYHRWHAPVDGVIYDAYKIQGTYLLDNSQFVVEQGAPQFSQAFLTAISTRQVIIIQSQNERIGKIAIVFIGMAQTSSCVATVQIGQRVQKGQQIGYFAFGGSSHLLLFEKDTELHFSDQLYEIKEGVKKSRHQLVKSFLASVK